MNNTEMDNTETHALTITSDDVSSPERFEMQIDQKQERNWSRGDVTIDNQASPKWGLNLNRDMNLRGIPTLHKGDLVTIEILRDGQVLELTGRASRKRTAYFDKSELEGIGFEVHDWIFYSIKSVNGAVPQTFASFEATGVNEPTAEPLASVVDQVPVSDVANETEATEGGSDVL